MLKIEGLENYYGRIQALKGVSLEVRTGEIVTIIGSNGAGKTTLLRTISGVLPRARGRIFYEHQDITGLSPSRRVDLGICQVPEGRHVFPTLSVKDNLRLGAYQRFGKGQKRKIEEDYEVAFDLFPVLRDRLRQKAGTLSGGEQQMLAMGRALMADPRLLLLDEPSMGLAPLVKETIFSTLTRFRQRGLTLLLVEQDAEAALAIADRGYVLQNGEIVLGGDAAKLAVDPQVKEIYFGQGPRREGNDV